MNRWTEVGRLARENGARTCRVVNAEGKRDPRCSGKFEENHHGVFPAQKTGQTDKEWRFFLDSPFNHCAACHSCNVLRVGDGSDARFQFFLLQVKKYGVNQMKIWLDGAPQEIKERAEWKRYTRELSDTTQKESGE